MSYLYFDDSKHEYLDYCLGAFVICHANPREEIVRIFQETGFNPEHFEYKSHSKMSNNLRMRELRARLISFIAETSKVAVCISRDSKGLGKAGLRLFDNILKHEDYKATRHAVFFDEGLFSSENKAKKNASDLGLIEFHNLYFEQESKNVLGIQLADCAAHTCATMLNERLGHITKTVRLQNTGYPEDTDIEIGFELWTGMRHCLLGEFADSIEPIKDMKKTGLFVDDDLSSEIKTVAFERFGEIYVGCIH